MKMAMIAALAAAQLPAFAPARAADIPSEPAATPPGGTDGVGRAPLEAGLKLERGDSEAPESPRASAAQADEPRKKRKSTGDKVLTGAAVILGVGALAVGGLLVAIFVG